MLTRCAIKEYILNLRRKNQIAVNLVTNILAMGITMLVGLWITPYLVHKMGFAGYGYVGLINSLIGFMTVLTYTLNSMSGRFLAVSLRRGGPEEASQYISSAFITNVFGGIFLLAVILLLTVNLNRIFDIRIEWDSDVKIAFFLSGVAFILSSIAIILSTAAYSSNRLDIINGITIFSNLARSIVLVLLFSFFSPSIWHYATATVLQVTITLILGVFTFRALLPDVHIHVNLFNSRMSGELLSSGFFNSVIMLGSVFMTQIDLLVGNRYLPAEIVGMYAAILLIPNAIRNIAVAISYAFSPTTMILYSSGRLDELREYSNKVVSFCGLTIGWPVAIVSGLAIPILGAWLSKDYSDYESTITLMLLPLAVNLAVRQLYNVQQALNKVKIPALVSVLLGITNLLLAIVFTARLQMGIFGIALSSAMMSTIYALVFIPIYTAVITHQPKFSYYRGLFKPLMASAATCMIGAIIQQFVVLDKLYSISGSALLLTLFYFSMTLALLSRGEREGLQRRLLSVLRAFGASSGIWLTKERMRSGL